MGLGVATGGKSPWEVTYIAPGEKTGVSDLIRRRAYELFVKRGRQPGHDVEDWPKQNKNSPANEYATQSETKLAEMIEKKTRENVKALARASHGTPTAVVISLLKSTEQHFAVLRKAVTNAIA